MDLKIYFAFLIAVLLQGSANAQYGSCTPTGRIASVGAAGSISINHLPSHGNCRYNIVSPADSYIQAECTLKLVDTTCTNQRFGVSRSGDVSLTDAVRYCQSGAYTIKSIGNELVLAIIMSPNTASFSCNIQAMSALTTGCDCGWNANTKIVGGTPTATNEFVPHAGLVLNGQKDAYCGAVIS